MNKIIRLISSNKKSFSFILTLIILLIGSSYAWLSLTLNTNTSNVINTGTLSVKFDDYTANGVSLDKALPITLDEGYLLEPYSFTITNDGNLKSDYTIYLDDLELNDGQSRIDDKYVRYSLIQDDEELSSYLLNTSGVSPHRIVYSGTISAGQTQSFSMRLWIDYDAANGAMNKYFNAGIRVEATQYYNKLCRRAKTLHSEECKNTAGSYPGCYGLGYSLDGEKGTTTITYGNLGTNGVLTSGDAFDCDVNGDGVFDSNTERFYYAYDMNNSIAMMIYYNNTYKGVPDNTAKGLIAYNADYLNTNETTPKSVSANLPTTSQWSNVSLTNSLRNIEKVGSNVSSPFDYGNYAARLITYYEMYNACDNEYQVNGSIVLNKCIYMLENTRFASNSDYGTWGYWLETLAIGDYSALRVFAGVSGVTIDALDHNYNYGTRPVIEVPKNRIIY